MTKQYKYQGKPTFHFQPEKMMVDGVMDLDSLRMYLKASVMSDGQLEEAVTSLISVLDGSWRKPKKACGSVPPKGKPGCCSCGQPRGHF